MEGGGEDDDEGGQVVAESDVQNEGDVKDNRHEVSRIEYSRDRIWQAELIDGDLVSFDLNNWYIHVWSPSLTKSWIDVFPGWPYHLMPIVISRVGECLRYSI